MAQLSRAQVNTRARTSVPSQSLIPFIGGQGVPRLDWLSFCLPSVHEFWRHHERTAFRTTTDVAVGSKATQWQKVEDIS
jgi:hypothetical protein